MYFLYKNSVLATLCSIFGSALAILAIGAMSEGELSILSGIAAIALGVSLMFLGNAISKRKAKKQRSKTVRTTAHAFHTVAQPVREVSYASQESDEAHRNSLNQCVSSAGILFMLAALLNFWAECQYNAQQYLYMMNSEKAMLIGMGALLMIAAFRTRHTRKISVLFVLGFLGMTWGSIDVAMVRYRDYGFGGYTDPTGIYYAMVHSPLLRAAGFFLMTIFALLSMEKRRERLGGIVKWLWFIPIPLLLLAYVKDISDRNVLMILESYIIKGFPFPPRPEILAAIAKFLVILAVCFTGICFRRICQSRATVYAYSEPQSVTTVPPTEEWTVQPQPEFHYTAPEPQKQPRKTSQQDVQKKIQAYKDLLELGILSQEEYEQKIHDLMCD